jgi:hypothetical protein
MLKNVSMGSLKKGEGEEQGVGGVIRVTRL